ncbi:S-adenosyl-L-methionine-dependent methyltransferase [Phytophthora cactorum]|nr:S-adenosyl-L-methionine-dependent methyltransferase [Phytophthora cactorum]
MEVYGAYGESVARIREAVVENQLAPVLLNGSKFDQDQYVKSLQKLLVAITFLEGHRSYEGSVKALDQAKELLVQVRRKCLADFVSVVSVLSRGERNDDGGLKWVEPSKHDASRAAQLLKYLLISGVDQKELLREYSKQRFDVIRMFLGEDPSGVSMGFDLNIPVTSLAKRLKDMQVTIEAEKALAGLIYSNEELANAAFRYSANQVLESWKKDIGVSLRSSKQLEAVKLLLVHDLLLARLEALESAALPPLLLRDRDGKGLDDPWILSKAVNAISTDLAETAKQKLFNFHPGRMEASGDRTVTRDGNVHPISSHVSVSLLCYHCNTCSNVGTCMYLGQTLNFLRKVCDQAKPLKILLAKDSDVSAVAFVDTVITQLIGALTAKADQLKGRESLKQLFLINNFGYVANSLPHCVQPDDADLEKQLHGAIKPRVEAMRNDALGAFIHLSYVSFKENLNDPRETLQYAKGGNVLTLESGRLLKEKFSLSSPNWKSMNCISGRFGDYYVALVGTDNTEEVKNQYETGRKHQAIDAKYLRQSPNPTNQKLEELVERAGVDKHVLEDPDRVVCDDVWTEERERLAREHLSQDKSTIPEFWQSAFIGNGMVCMESVADCVAVCGNRKYEKEAAKSWDKFYKRNSTNFYKDRHYLHLVFEDLGVVPPAGETRTLLEVGSGVGNAALPLLEINPALNIVAIDFADSAIDLLKIEQLFTEAGLVPVENEYIRRQYANRQQNVVRFRVWVHAIFEKPLTATDAKQA